MLLFALNFCIFSKKIPKWCCSSWAIAISRGLPLSSKMTCLFNSMRGLGQSCKCQRGFIYLQKFSLVNVKLKWVKDKALDAAVAGQRELQAACILVFIIFSHSHGYVPIYHLSRYCRQVGLPGDLKLATFIRRYPTIFREASFLDSGGTPVPMFCLTPEATNLHNEEHKILEQNKMDLVNRLCKLLMLTKDMTLPLQTIDQLKWDLGLPFDYHQSLIPQYLKLFSFVNLLDGRVGLKLLSWDNHLAVSNLQRDAAILQGKEREKSGCLAFPIRFSRGFGLKKKCMKWLQEWQELPYTSPYCDALQMDPRTDVSEKRIVGVFHELLHLTIQKKTERKNVSNLRRPLSLPQKFTKVFERHPGIFYISKKSDTQTVILREAYNGQQLLEKHPLVEIRERYDAMMREGFLDRSRGFYKKDQVLVSWGRSNINYEHMEESHHGNQGQPNGEMSSDNFKGNMIKMEQIADMPCP